MKSEKKKPKTKLQEYLSRPLPPFARGTGDCVAFVSGWINEQAGKEIITIESMTYGDVVRSLREKDLLTQTSEKLEDLGAVKVDDPEIGDVVLFEHEHALNGQAIGIATNEGVITRISSASLFLEKSPSILEAWRIQS